MRKSYFCSQLFLGMITLSPSRPHGGTRRIESGVYALEPEANVCTGRLISEDRENFPEEMPAAGRAAYFDAPEF